MMGFARHGVAFPATNTSPGIHNGWRLVNRDPARHDPAPIIGAIAFAPRLLATQTAVQIPAGVFIGVEILVDPLMADAHPLLLLQSGHNLLRAPCLADQPFDMLPDARVKTGLGLFSASRQGQAVGLLRPIAFQPLIALEFKGDRGLVSGQRRGNRRRVEASFLQNINLISFLLGQLRVAAQVCSSCFGRWENTTMLPQLALPPTM